ncbi:hypothetical protein HSX11_01750 [Oxalobacteraceae bacterium]|nr:hypothetical protein [Oxalobacteraceae bacterium]
MPDQNHEHEEPAQRREWHLDKTVSITHLFSTIAAIATLVVLGSKFDTRVTLLEQTNAAQHAVDTRQDKETDDFKRTVREDYRAIDDKLQRLIERVKP